jgi:hypothetical protein
MNGVFQVRARDGLAILIGKLARTAARHFSPSVERSLQGSRCDSQVTPITARRPGPAG